VQAFEEALQILRDYRPLPPARIAYQHRAGCGHAATEAPRGTLYHRLECDAAGRITAAKIVPPTSQNQSQIERDLRSYLPRWIGQSDEATATACERLVRSYDPCISCSTHFLKTTIQHD
jgi:coenzyme F420-reducing hydrogenase alpha subunit